MARWKNRPEGSNWGDFGTDDQAGRINLLTPEHRLGGIAEVKIGKAFCLSLPLDYPGGQMVDFRYPPELTASCDAHGHAHFNSINPGGIEATCDDRVTLNTQYSTQWDSLAHYGRLFDADGDGEAELVYYNGFRAGEHLVGPGAGNVTEAKALGIENLAMAGVQGRGVLINMKKQFGLERRAASYDDLMRAIDDQRVDVRKGDFVLIYTGFDRALFNMNKVPDPAASAIGCALDGGDLRMQKWVDDSGLIALCSDNIAVESVHRFFAEEGHELRLPLHELCLFRLGIHLGELWYLEELAHWLDENKRSAFLLTAPPLRLPGSVGSPVTPVATV